MLDEKKFKPKSSGEELNMKPADLALNVPQILLPKEDVDLTLWTVIACDQYTSEPEYWQAVDRLVGCHIQRMPGTLATTS